MLKRQLSQWLNGRPQLLGIDGEPVRRPRCMEMHLLIRRSISRYAQDLPLGRRARTTVVPTESGVLRQDQETIRLRLTLHLLTMFGTRACFRAGWPVHWGSHVTPNAPAVVVGAALPQASGSLLVSLWDSVLRSRFIS